MHQRSILWVAFVLITIATVSCRYAETMPRRKLPVADVHAAPSGNLSSACVGNYDPQVDYFPDKTDFQYSAQLKISYHRNYKILTFQPSVATQETFRYALVQCGTPAPKGFASHQVIQVPAATFITANQTIASATVALGLVDRLTGVGSYRQYTAEPILEQIRARRIQEVGGGTHANIETTLALRPDLYFTFYSAYPESNMHPKLWEVGIKAAPISDHTETTPLGRAEWLKYLALFFNKEKQANAFWTPLEKRYLQLQAKANDVPNRPTVMLGWGITKDEWTLAGGRNYLAQLIRDAGGKYFWTDAVAGSLVSIPYEQALNDGSAATFWTTNSYSGKRLSALTGFDARLKLFRPVRDQQVYGWIGGSKVPWRYPFGDQVLDKPDVLLADLLSVVHPELTPEYNRVYLQHLEP